MKKILVKKIHNGQYGVGTEEDFEHFHIVCCDYTEALEQAIDMQEMCWEEKEKFFKIEFKF